MNIKFIFFVAEFHFQFLQHVVVGVVIVVVVVVVVVVERVANQSCRVSKFFKDQIIKIRFFAHNTFNISLKNRTYLNKKMLLIIL